MADFYLKSGSGVAEFALSNAYSSGARMVPRRSNTGTNYLLARRWVWECTTAGTSAGADPTWPGSVTQDVTTVTSGGATFTARKPGFSSGTTINWNYATIYADYLNGALAAGDTIFFPASHDESVTGAVSIELPGSMAVPTFMLCVAENGSSRPVTLANGGRFTSSTDIQVGAPSTPGGFVYGHGLVIRCGNGSSSAQYARYGHSSNNDDHWSKWVDCAAEVLTSDNSGSSRVDIRPDGSARGLTEFVNLQLRFSAAAHHIICNGGNVKITGLSRYGVSGSTPNGTGNAVVRVAGTQSVQIEGFDASGWASNVNLFDGGNRCNIRVRGVKVPASWSGSLVDNFFGLVEEAYRVEATEFGAKWGLFISHQRFGNIRDDTTVYRSGGASIEGQALSWRFTTTANVSWPICALSSLELYPLPVEAANIGVLHTATVELIANLSSAVTNADAWLSAEVRSDSTDMLIAAANGSRPLLDTTATALATSTASWLAAARGNSTAYALGAPILVQGKVCFCTTAGTSAGSEPGGYASVADGATVTDGSAVFRAGRRHRMTVSFTPNQSGFVRLKMHVARASITNGIFACPQAELTT